MSRTAVYVCDDVAGIRLLVRAALEREPELAIVGEAGDGATAIADVERLQPGVLVLDLSLPVVDGLEVLDALAARAARTRTVVFSGYGDARVRERALAAGAHAYVEKGAPLEELVRAVKALAQERAA